ncbi:MAG: RusA family crossover junction endodeoxyribonuclease [Caulobacter sp.]
MISVTLPFPPSTNRLWRSVNGRNIKSAEYREWEARAVAGLGRRNAPPLTGPYSILFNCERPDRRRRDLGNLEKALSDALVTGKVIADDCNAERITLAWVRAADSKAPVVRVEIEALAPQPGVSA